MGWGSLAAGTFMNRVFLDTNVLVSSMDTTRKFHEEALGLVTKVKGGGLEAFISTQVVGELYVSLTRSYGGSEAPLNPAAAEEELDALLGSGLFTILPVTSGAISRAVTLSAQKGIRGVKFWDTVIVATMLESGIPALGKGLRIEGVKTKPTKRTMPFLPFLASTLCQP